MVCGSLLASCFIRDSLYYREFTTAATLFFFGVKKNDQDDPMCQSIFRVFFHVLARIRLLPNLFQELIIIFYPGTPS
jgi:hypothetical protein